MSCGLPLTILSPDGSKAMLQFMRDNEIGLMISAPRLKKTFPGFAWAFDNGAYTAYAQGLPFDEKTFLKALKTIERCEPKPVFGVAPDILGGGLRSLDFTMEWWPRLPTTFPWYIAAQPGITPKDVEPMVRPGDGLQNFAGIFLGGPGQWRMLSYPGWRALADKYGLKVHIGRMGTARRVAWAVQNKVDSIDSSNWVQGDGFGAIEEAKAILKQQAAKRWL